MARVIFLITLLLAVAIQQSQACSCMPEHPQVHACKADFVVLARILSRKPTKDPSIPDANYIGYKLKITQVFKSNGSADEALLRSRFVTTPSEDSMCGVNLQIKQLYLITGNVYDGRAHINMCSFVKPWNHLSLVQRKGFRRAYYENCQCKVKVCWHASSCTRLVDQGCWWNIDFANEDKDCQLKHTMCVRHNNGMCSWEENRYHTHCVTKTRSGDIHHKSYNEASDFGHHNRRDP